MNLQVLKLKHYFLILISGLLFSCTVKNNNQLFSSPNDIVTDTISQVFVVNDLGSDNIYKIKAQDQLLIRNLQDKNFLAPILIENQQNLITSEKNQTFEVDATGTINIPLYGKVEVLGLTRREVREKLQKLFAKDQISPIIEVSVVNLKVTLLGEFKTQGNFLMEQDNLTLIDIIAEAGGLTENADLKTCKIIRGDRSNPEIIYVNLHDIKSLASKKLLLQNNDLIVIQAQNSYVVAKKIQNFNNYLQPVLVLLNLGLLIFTITK